MRFNASCTLEGGRPTVDDEGNPSTALTQTEAYCNVRNLGLEDRLECSRAGLKADAEVELRSVDYAGQVKCTIDGTRYTVEQATDSGEFTRLILARRADDVR